jgi:hypothetical protein
MKPIEMQLINEKGIITCTVDVLMEFVRSVKVDTLREYTENENKIISTVDFRKKYGIDAASIMRYIESYPELLHSHPTERKYYVYEQKMIQKMQEHGKGKVRAINYTNA